MLTLVLVLSARYFLVLVKICRSTDTTIITNCTLQRNTAAHGGAVATVGEAKVIIKDTLFRDNTAQSCGGALSSLSNGTEVTNCVFAYNTAKQTGGAAHFSVSRGVTTVLYGNASTAVAIITNTTYFNNSAVQQAGAVYIAVSVNVKHFSSLFDTNLANTGAAVYIEPYASALFKDSSFTNNGNSDTIAGGAIAAFYHLEVVIDTCLFDGNKAVSGSSVHNDLGSITVTSSMLTGNMATGDGTIWTSDTAEILNCTFVTNLANQGSGVFISTDDAVVSCNSNKFVQNTAIQAGAAIFQFTAVTPTVAVSSSNSFTDNTAGCCYALGYGSAAQWQDTAGSCIDYDSGTGRQCCAQGEYINDGTCLRCSEEFTCIETGLTLNTLPLPAGFWRETTTQLNLRECWNRGACIGGAAVSGNTNDYCATGYKGPCKYRTDSIHCYFLLILICNTLSLYTNPLT
jgi:hypothetical protein